MVNGVLANFVINGLKDMWGVEGKNGNKKVVYGLREKLICVNLCWLKKGIEVFDNLSEFSRIDGIYWCAIKMVGCDIVFFFEKLEGCFGCDDCVKPFPGTKGRVCGQASIVVENIFFDTKVLNCGP